MSGWESSNDKLNRSVIGSIIVFLCIVGIYGYLRSPGFDLQHVQVVGVRRISPDLVIARTGLQPLIGSGANIFSLPIRDIVSDLSSEPMISRVVVRRKLPDTVIIEIKERLPICLLPGKEGLYYLGQDGVVISVVEKGKADLPVVAGVDPVGVKEGTSLTGPAIEVLLNLYQHGNGIWEQLSEINIQDSQEITAFTTDLAKIHFGDGTELERKLKVLENLLQKDASFREVDLRVPGTPVVKKR